MGHKKRLKYKKKVISKELKPACDRASSFSEFLLIIGLVFLTLVVFSQALDFSFINYDDDSYVYENYMVLHGLSWPGLIWAFTSQLHDHWHPLTWLSHMLDCQLFGLKAGWHHATNLFFHLLNTLLLYYFLKRATGYRWRAWLVAVLFAIHPLHVESVVWVASRKDILSGFFFLLTLFAYTLYVQNKSKMWYLLVLLASLCGMMAKSILVTLPFTLILLDYWPLQRREKGVTGDNGGLLSIYRQPRIWIEKIPLFIISAGVSAWMVFIHSDRLYDVSREFFPFSVRLGRAIDSYIVYLFKLFWPSRLTIAYVYELEPQVWWVVSAGFVLMLLTIGSIYFSKSRPYFFVGWFWYIGTLVPVSGLVNTGPQTLAYRYTYLSLIGLFICLVWGVNEIIIFNSKVSVPKWMVAAGWCVAIVTMMSLSFIYTSHWQNSKTLFSHLHERFPNNYAIYLNLATAYSDDDNYAEAFKIYKYLVNENPDNSKALNGFGLLLARRKDLSALKEAKRLFKRSLDLEPNSMTRINLGIVLAKLGYWEGAAEELKHAIAQDPLRPKAHFNYGLVLLKLGKIDSAKNEFQRVIVLEPTYRKAHDQLARIQGFVD